jgi:hypothetical protein
MSNISFVYKAKFVDEDCILPPDWTMTELSLKKWRNMDDYNIPTYIKSKDMSNYNVIYHNNDNDDMYPRRAIINFNK